MKREKRRVRRGRKEGDKRGGTRGGENGRGLIWKGMCREGVRSRSEILDRWAVEPRGIGKLPREF